MLKKKKKEEDKRAETSPFLTIEVYGTKVSQTGLGMP